MYLKIFSIANCKLIKSLRIFTNIPYLMWYLYCQLGTDPC